MDSNQRVEIAKNFINKNNIDVDKRLMVWTGYLVIYSKLMSGCYGHVTRINEILDHSGAVIRYGTEFEIIIDSVVFNWRDDEYCYIYN